MDVDDGGVASHKPAERPAGFVSLMDSSSIMTRPTTPRTPFMPTPRKRHIRPVVPVSLSASTSTSPTKTGSPFPPKAQPLQESLTANDVHMVTPAVSLRSPTRPPTGPRELRPASALGPTPSARPPPERTTSPIRRTCTASPTRKVVPTDPPARAVPPTRPATSLAVSRPPFTSRTPGSSSSAVASTSRPVRAKVTEGILPVHSAPDLRKPPASTRTVRVGDRPMPARLPRPPSPSERIDVLSLASEIGEGSFVLHQDDTPIADSVQVHVRVRPPHEEEECAWVVDLDSSTIMLDPAIAQTKAQPNVGLPYHLDGVHTGSSNADVYTTMARPLVHSVLHGYHAVIFAYGQTASGKTFTLSGDEDGLEPGVIPRAIHDLFQGICQGAGEREYLLRVSYLEIWNEIVKDLLEPTNHPFVRDDRRLGANAVRVAPLHEAVVTSPAQVFRLLARGEANRHVGATDWNERSSRSHTCFKITVESWDRDPSAPKPYRIGELSLIDLAGSERHSMHSTNRRAEGGNINKSLLSLGKVIYALSEKSHRGAAMANAHIPYRDSKLTRILQNNLNGHARIAVVCTLNPSPTMVEESLSTLNFARRIKHVAVKAERNEYDGDLSSLDESHALLARYKEEMGTLRAQVAELRTASQDTSGIGPPSLQSVQARLDELGALILQSGMASASIHDAWPPHPVSPAKQRGFTFDDPLTRVQEKLHAALNKIHRLEKQLARRLSLPAAAGSDEAAKNDLIRDLMHQIRELETVCDAQAQEAPRQVREDVEAEWADRVAMADELIQERDAFIQELSQECRRLRRANEALTRLAHDQTAAMVEQIAAVDKPPVMSLFAPHLRPATVLGVQKPLRATDLSIDTGSSTSGTEDLSSSDVDELLESAM